ncbi:MAG TPA: helix-turn-helix domain-containing protein [Thermoanaerobaculia bacterium]|nr:helix-turn-helix domain-containing protein [Thermoanaerobaculia bacterium]
MPVSTREKVQALSRDFGSQRRVAALLGVSPSQVSRWIRSGGVDPDNAEKVDALEHAMGSLLRLYESAAAEAWLVGFNPHLGARPIDLVRAGRASELLRAISVERAGSYA